MVSITSSGLAKGEAFAVALRKRLPWCEALIAAVWQVQSRLAAMALIGLVALANMWVALAVMLAWSLLATIAFVHMRRLGLATSLEMSQKPRRSTGWPSKAYHSAIALSLVGWQAFCYNRAFCPLLLRPAGGSVSKVARTAVLLVGLTLFGVVSAQHLLSSAGYRDDQLLHMGFLGSCLNVSYRVVLGALTLNIFTTILYSLLSLPRFV